MYHQDESTRGVRMSKMNVSEQHNREDARGLYCEDVPFLILCPNPEPLGTAADLLRIRGDPRALLKPNIVGPIAQQG